MWKEANVKSPASPLVFYPGYSHFFGARDSKGKWQQGKRGHLLAPRPGKSKDTCCFSTAKSMSLTMTLRLWPISYSWSCIPYPEAPQKFQTHMLHFPTTEESTPLSQWFQKSPGVDLNWPTSEHDPARHQSFRAGEYIYITSKPWSEAQPLELGGGVSLIPGMD